MIIPGRVKTKISMNALDKDGNAHNKMDEGQEKGLSSDLAAKIIVRKLEKEKKEILVGGKELIMVILESFALNCITIYQRKFNHCSY